MMEFFNMLYVMLEDYINEYMVVTFIAFTSVWLLYFYPRLLPKSFYGLYRKEYVSKDEKGGIKFTIEPTIPYRNYAHTPVMINKCIHIDIGLEDYFFKRRYRDMRFEKAIGLAYFTRVLGSYRKLSLSNIEDNINSALEANKDQIGYYLGVHNIDVNKVEIDFKLTPFVKACYFNYGPIGKIVKDMRSWVTKVKEFQDFKIMSLLLREYGYITIKYNGKVMLKYNKCFEIVMLEK